MSIIEPKTFTEELAQLESDFSITLKHWKTTFSDSQRHPESAELKAKVENYTKKLNDIIDNKTTALKNELDSAGTKINDYIKDLEFDTNNKKNMKNVYTGNLMRLDRGDLAAEPRRVDAYEQKIYHLVSLAYYFFGTILIIFLFKSQLNIKDKIRKHSKRIPTAHPANTPGKMSHQAKQIKVPQ